MYNLNLFLLLFITFTIWSIGALYFKNDDVSWLEAYKTFLEEIVNWFQPSKQSEILYPVDIGIDEWGCPYANIIEKEFYSVLKNFISYYFQNHLDCQNRLEYYFFVSGFKPDITEDWEKILYLRDIAEQVVHHYIYKNYPSFGAIPNNLVALKLTGNTLFISIAKNAAGTEENTSFTDTLRKRLKQNSQPPNLAVVDEELEKELKEMENYDEHEN